MKNYIFINFACLKNDKLKIYTSFSEINRE